MDMRKLIFVLIVLYVNFISVKEALDCYSCADTIDNGHCQNSVLEMEGAYQEYHHEYENDTENLIEWVKKKPLLKHCSGGWDKNCIIQQAIREGKTTAYIRDCSNGKTFISGSNDVVTSDNQTNYYFDTRSGTLFKTRLCNESLCNGPNPNLTTYDQIKNTGNPVCYSCIDTTNNGDCKTDIAGLEETFRKYNDSLKKKVTGTSSSTEKLQKLTKCTEKGDMCMILDVSVNGQTQFYFRDCTSGIKIPYAYNLERRLSDNKTRCGLDTSTAPAKLVCLTLCRGQFCNGPKSSASHAGHGTYFILMLFILSVIYNLELS